MTLANAAYAEQSDHDHDQSLLWFNPTTTSRYFGSIRPRPVATLVRSDHDHDQSLLWFDPTTTTTSRYFGSIRPRPVATLAQSDHDQSLLWFKTRDWFHKTGGCLYLTKCGSWPVACLWLRRQRILLVLTGSLSKGSASVPMTDSVSDQQFLMGQGIPNNEGLCC